MGVDNRKAAQQLLVAGNLRSSISRAYYAAYCAVTSQVAGRYQFGYGGNNPAHNDLANLIVYNLTLPVPQRWEVRKAVGRLWAARVEADYVPAAYIDRQIALNALRDATRVLLLLEIDDE